MQENLSDYQKQKQEAIDVIRRRTAEQHEQLESIDPRLAEFYDHICEHSGVMLGDENDLHNIYEILCAIRFLRILRTYPFDTEEVQDAIYDGEGEWHRDADGFWTHVCGGLGQPGRQGNEVYRWEPFQIFCIAAMYGPKAWIGTGSFEGDRRLSDTERINEETREIEDMRRICTRFILYGPRKINKSGLAAFHNVRDFMKGDHDANIFCTANSEKQATILFNKTKDLLLELDPVSGRSYRGKFLEYSATKIKFQKNAGRSAKIEAIPAGGKMPDGEFASTCCGDEYGSAGYTNGRSDMGQTIAVIESSMGPRRNPLTLITTTASLITTGPFVEILDSTHRMLLRELEYDKGTATPSPTEDRQMMLLMEPDEYERDEEYMLTSRTLRLKVNHMLGKIAQHSFYDDEVTKSRMDETKKKETISKLFNVYQSANVTDWIKPEEVRPLQRPVRIEDCKAADGWVVICGMDFSKGDDLHSVTYLAVRKNETTGGTEFFSDIDAWITEKALHESSIRTLYEKWIAEGWLHLCPGAVLQPSLPVNRIVDLIENHGVSFIRWGYDAYQSKDPINTLKAYLWEAKGVNPDIYVVAVSQTFASYNPAVLKIEAVVWNDPPLITLSMNPLWPWCFGNCVISEDVRMNNRKMIKRNPGSDACKVDPIQCLATCFILLDQIDGHLQKTEG